MKIVSPLPHKKARLEVVPLIDIMFFLLASFMMVSLTMTKQRTVSVNLPAVSAADSSLKPETIQLAVTQSGQLYIDKQAIELPALEALLKQRLTANALLPVYISGDAATPHGSMVAVLDYVRRCGVTKVAFNVQASPP
jgi:biopolymer transport protein ExbD